MPIRLFWSLFALFFIARVVLAILSFRGDARPQSLERARKYFSAEAIDQGFEYHRAGFAVSLALMILSQAVLLAFILTGASASLADWCLDWTGGPPFATAHIEINAEVGRTEDALHPPSASAVAEAIADKSGGEGSGWLGQTALYLAILMIATTVATLPFDFYFGYVLEHRFGFSNLDVAGWLKLQAKSFAIGFPLTLAIGVAAYALLRFFPHAWVVVLPAGALGLQLVLTVLFPLLILPLFYKVQAVSDPALLGPLREVCAKAGVELEEVKLIDASRYSSKTNAFFTGFGRHKSIYLFDTLVAKHTPQETAAVLAHELGHWRHHHVAKGIALSTLGLLAACVALQWLAPRLEASSYLHFRGLADIGSLPVLLLLGSIAGFFASPISSGISRHFERQADAACLELTAEREVYVQDFKKLAEENRANLLPHPVVVWWRYSHPPIVERIESVANSE